MTEEERRNRNPAPERLKVSLADHPAVTYAELELHKVYILVGKRHAATFNYMGPVASVHPDTGEPITLFAFRGPRVSLDVFLRGRADGALEDREGNAVQLRRFTGPDA